MYTSLLPNVTYERDGYCVTADYTIKSPGVISIVNAQTIGAPDGELMCVEGTAKVLDFNDPARWEVTINNSEWWDLLIPQLGNYRVIGLSAISPVTNKYAWAGTSIHDTIWTLN